MSVIDSPYIRSPTTQPVYGSLCYRGGRVIGVWGVTVPMSNSHKAAIPTPPAYPIAGKAVTGEIL